MRDLKTAITAGVFAAINPLVLGAQTVEVAANPTPELSYRVITQSLNGFLNELIRDSGDRIDVSADVRGHLSHVMHTGRTETILDQLAVQHSLDWFAFNGVYYISAKSEAMTRMTRLGDLTDEAALDALEASGLLFDRFPVRRTAEQSALAISGPPKYLALVEAVIENIPSLSTPIQSAAINTVVVRKGTEETVVPLR